jgi:hypothetical protein
MRINARINADQCQDQCGSMPGSMRINARINADQCQDQCGSMPGSLRINARIIAPPACPWCLPREHCMSGLCAAACIGHQTHDQLDAANDKNKLFATSSLHFSLVFKKLGASVLLQPPHTIEYSWVKGRQATKHKTPGTMSENLPDFRHPA